MPSRYPRFLFRYAVVVAAVVTWLGACADPQREPARQAIAAIEAELTAAGTDPAKYIPGELKDVQARLEELKQHYATGEFDAVVGAAPAVLAAAKGLASTAAARAAELDQALRQEWTGLVATMPTELATLRSAVERVAALPALPAGLDPDRLRLAGKHATDAQALWDRARQEQAAGRLPEAVTLATQARDLARQAMTLPGFGASKAAVK
jgi:hypothetical protein